MTGTVVKVSVSQRSGTHFLNFCPDYRDCPFSVVVFAKDLSKVGDVRHLEGKILEIYGKIRVYKGQAEIILNDLRQLRGQSARLPPLPRKYDVETRGSGNPGEFKTADTQKKAKRSKRRGSSDPEPGEADPGPPDDK